MFVLGVLVSLFVIAPQSASAQTCIQDVWKAHGNNQGLTCTAGDVTLSAATNIQISSGGSCDANNVCGCFAGQTVVFTADFEMDLNADTRYDIGFYLATDNDPNHDGAKTGQCTAAASLMSNTQPGNFINLDAAPDVCGDITGNLGSANNPIFVRTQVSATCPTSAGQQLSLPFATTWRQPGANTVCRGIGNGGSTNDVYPGSPSKCNFGTLILPITSIPTDFTVTKSTSTASVPETGGSATYTISVQNNAAIAVKLTSLTDNQYGDITQTHAAGGGFKAVTATTCTPDGNVATCEVGNGGTIPAMGSCSCTFTGAVPPGNYPGSFTDIATVCAVNPTQPDTPVCRTDDATVPYSDVPQAPTLRKTASSVQCQIDVTYTVVVTNGAGQDPFPGPLTLNSLSDDRCGDITSVHGASTVNAVISTTCAVGQQIAAGTSYTCSFVCRITSCSTTQTNTITAGATDDDGQVYSPTTTPPLATASATVVVNVAL